MSDALAADNAVKVTRQAPACPEFVRPDDLEWVPWLLEDTYFKLLSANERTGGYTCIVKVGPDNTSPPHMHIGDAEAINLEGDMGYGDGARGRASDYVREYAGVIHAPDSKAGMVVLIVMHGSIVGYLPDGSVAAVVDARMMYNLAKEAGQAGHIKAHFEYMDGERPADARLRVCAPFGVAGGPLLTQRPRSRGAGLAVGSAHPAGSAPPRRKGAAKTAARPLSPRARDPMVGHDRQRPEDAAWRLATTSTTSS